MSVIVTGIEMPKSCVRCDLCDSGGYRMALKRQTDKNIYERYKGCPLKSVDGLIEKLNKAGADNDKSVFKNLHLSYIQGLKDAMKIIKEYCGMEDE